MRYIFIRILAVCALVWMIAPGGAQAQDSASPAFEGKKHAALIELEKQGYEVYFLGNAYGVDGWMIRNNDEQAQYAYTTPDGGLITGLLFDPDGNIYTAVQLEQFQDVIDEGSQAAMAFSDEIEASSAPKSEKIYAEIELAKYFTVGDPAKPYIYTFMNPTCVHCVTFWTDHMRPLVDNGTLHIRFIPFGAEDQNRDAAALLLTAGNAEDIWRDYANGDMAAYDKKDADIPQGIFDAVDVNTGLYRKLKLKDVPFSIYRAPADGKVKVLAGVPGNAMMISADFIK